MENDITIYIASYVFTRLAVLAAFAYLFYQVLRPARARVRADRRPHAPVHRATSVPEDC